MVAVVFGEPIGQVLFRHEHAGRIEVADIKDDQWASVVVLGNVVDGGSAAKPMHRKETDRVLIEHRLKQAAHGALLAHHHDADGLLVPKVATIRSRDSAGICFGVSPSRYPLDGAALVNNPFPRDVTDLARLFQ